MLSFFGKKYIDVIGTIRVKDLIKKEYFHVRNRENELYIFLEKCFVTLGVIKVGKPDFNNQYYTCSNFSTNDMSKADAAKAHQKKYSLQNDTSFAQYIEDTFEKAFDLIMHDHADRAEAQKVLDKYNEAKAKKFTCWGIGHDCTIKTQDDVTLYWDEATQTLSVI